MLALWNALGHKLAVALWQTHPVTLEASMFEQRSLLQAGVIAAKSGLAEQQGFDSIGPDQNIVRTSQGSVRSTAAPGTLKAGLMRN